MSILEIVCLTTKLRRTLGPTKLYYRSKDYCLLGAKECRLIPRYQGVEGTHCLYLQGPEHSHRHKNCSENLITQLSSCLPVGTVFSF